MNTLLHIQTLSDQYEMIDLFDDISIPLTLQVADIRDISKKTSAYSQEFIVPATNHNKKVFGLTSVADTQTNITMAKKYPCQIIQGGYDVFYGVLKLQDIMIDNNNEISYKCQISSNLKNFFESISDETLIGNTESWRDIYLDDYQVWKDSFTTNAWLYRFGYYVTQPNPTDDGWGICVIDRSNHIGVPFGKFVQPHGVDPDGESIIDHYYRWGQEWYSFETTPYVFATTLLDRIISQSGFKWESNFFGHSDTGWSSGHSFLSNNFASDTLKQIGKFNTNNLIVPASTRNGLIETGNNFAEKYVQATETEGSDDDSTQSQLVFSGSLTSTYETAETNYIVRNDGGFNSTILTPSTFKFSPSLSENGWYNVSLDYHIKISSQFCGIEDGSYTVLTPGQRVVWSQHAFNIRYWAESVHYAVRYKAVLGRLVNNVFYAYRTLVDMKKYVNDPNSNYTMTYQDTTSDMTLFDEDINVSSTFFASYGETWVVQYSIEVMNMAKSSSNVYCWEVRDDQDRFVKYGVLSYTYAYLSAKQGKEIISFKHLADDNIAPHRDIDPTKFLNKNTKKTDFIKNLCKQFNLYIEDISNKPCEKNGKYYPQNTLRIEPRDVFYKPEYKWDVDSTPYDEFPYTKDWTDKVDFSSITFSRPDEYLYKDTILQNKDDGDFFVKEYNNDTTSKLEVGAKLISAKYSADSEENIVNGFAQTIVGSVTDRGCKMKIAKQLSINNGKTDLDKRWDDRLLFLTQYIPDDEPNNYARNKYLIMHNGLSDTYHKYPLASTQNAENNNSNGCTKATADLNFWTNRYYYSMQTKQTCNNAYNAFYRNMMNELQSDDARVMKCSAYLTAKDIKELKLSDIIVVDSVKYHISSINWSNEKTMAKCEFIKILPIKELDDYNYIDPNTHEKYYNVEANYSLTIPNIQTDANHASNNLFTNGGTSITNVTIETGGGGSTDNYSLGGGGSSNNVILYKNGTTHSTITMNNIHQYTLGNNRIQGKVDLLQDGTVCSTVDLPIFTGASSQSGGYKGLVPPPTSEDRTKFLCGNGEWVPVQGGSGHDYMLDTDEHGVNVQLWRDNYPQESTLVDDLSLNEFEGATQFQDGWKGFVPRPMKVNRNMFLCGNGQWEDVPQNYYWLDTGREQGTLAFYENDELVNTIILPPYEGCGASMDGETGLVPPSVRGQQDYYLSGSGSWKPLPSTSQETFKITINNSGQLDRTYDQIKQAFNDNKFVYAERLYNVSNISKKLVFLPYDEQSYYGVTTSSFRFYCPCDEGKCKILTITSSNTFSITDECFGYYLFGINPDGTTSLTYNAYLLLLLKGYELVGVTTQNNVIQYFKMNTWDASSTNPLKFECRINDYHTRIWSIASDDTTSFNDTYGTYILEDVVIGSQSTLKGNFTTAQEVALGGGVVKLKKTKMVSPTSHSGETQVYFELDYYEEGDTFTFKRLFPKRYATDTPFTIFAELGSNNVINYYTVNW